MIPTLPDRAELWPYFGRIEQARHYTNFGPLNRELESRLEQLFKTHRGNPVHVRSVSSATLGIELTLSAMRLPPGSRVLVPALTFVATLTAVLRAGLVPVVTDVDPHSWLLTPAIAAAALVSTGARAVLAVSTFGRAQDTLAWSAFQKDHGVKVMIDAAGAFGTQWVEAVDIPVVFSMHATKSLTAGEGGFVVCGKKSIAARVGQMSNFGINLEPDSAVPVGYLSSCGTNAKLSEFHAAVALASLDRWTQHASRRHALYQAYQAQLVAASAGSLLWQSGPVPEAPTIFAVRAGSPARRDHLEAACAKHGIATRRWYQPLLHQHAACIGPLIALPAPVSEQIAGDLIGLPFFLDITNTQMDLVAATVSRSLGALPPLKHPTALETA
jgi:dTDP-4-amino-4,6-dideoxygalactose transaminase